MIGHKNIKRCIIAAAVLSTVLNAGAETSGLNVELRPWDLPDKLEFIPVQKSGRLSQNPSYLTQSIQTLVVKRIMATSMLVHTDFIPEYVQRAYVAGLRKSDNHEVVINYLAFSFSKEYHLKQFVELYRPVKIPERSGMMSLWFNKKWVVVLELKQQGNDVPEEYTRLENIISERCRKCVKFSY